MAYLSETDKIVLIDAESKCLIQCDSDGKLVQKFKIKHIIDSPLTVCTNLKNEIFIGGSKKVAVFDKGINCLRKFKIKYKGSTDMTYDEETHNLYIANQQYGMITVWNGKSGDFQCKFEVEKPYNVRVNEKYLIVLSHSICESTRLSKSKKLKNYIFLFEKSADFSLVKIIKLNEWMHPRGLFIDRNCNILTTGFEKKENIISSTRFFYVFDFNGNCIFKKDSHINFITDLLIINRKKLFVIDPTQKIISNKDSNSRNDTEAISVI